MSFDKRIKALNQELLDLKTSSEYSSVRSSSLSSAMTVRTGVYRVTFGTTGEPIMARYYINSAGSQIARALYLRIFPRTPSTNTQEIEINTTVPTDYGQSSITYDVNLTILANRPIIQVERIS